MPSQSQSWWTTFSMDTTMFRSRNISARRKANHEIAFDHIAWHSYELINRGLLGDRPQFKILGRIQGFNNVKVVYRTTSPGGGSSSLKLYVGQRLLRSWRPAPQYKARQIQDEIFRLLFTRKKPSLKITQRRLKGK